MSFNKSPKEIELENYLASIDGQLATENSKFVNGDGVYVGSRRLREFYRGKQWDYKKKGGGKMRVYNYVFTVVENMTAFLANQPPEQNSIPRSLEDPVERVRSEQISRLLQEIHRANKMPIQFQKGARIGSLTGNTFIFGPIWDEFSKNIQYYTMEMPENVRPIWKDDNYNEMIGFTIETQLDLQLFKTRYADKLAERGIDAEALTPHNPGVGHEGKSMLSSSYEKGLTSGNTKNITLVQYYDDEYYALRIKHGEKESFTIDFREHKYGFVPGYFIPNIHNPGSPNGTADGENILDAQVAYNEAKSDEEDIVHQVAYSALWGKNIDSYSLIQTGAGVMYSFNDEAEINAMPRSENPVVLNNFESAIQGDMINLSGQNQALYPGGARQVLGSTGRALSVLMQGINNKVSLRRDFWKFAFESLNRNILMLAEKKITGAKELISGNYATDVFISSVLLRDTTEEINKFNMKLQSMTTTQKNLGIPAPSEEQKLMKQEWQDPLIMAEIARQPALLMQIIQGAVQEQLGANADQALLGQGEGEPSEEQPASAPQQRGVRTSSPEGEVNARTQRETGAPLAANDGEA